MVKLNNEITKKMLRENESGVVHRTTTNSRHERRKKKALEKIMEERMREVIKKDKRVVVAKDTREIIRNKLPLAKRVSKPTVVLRNTLFRSTDYFKASHLIKNKNEFEHFDKFSKKSDPKPVRETKLIPVEKEKEGQFKSKEFIEVSSSSSESESETENSSHSSESEVEEYKKDDQDEGDGCLMVSEENMVVV